MTRNYHICTPNKIATTLIITQIKTLIKTHSIFYLIRPSKNDSEAKGFPKLNFCELLEANISQTRHPLNNIIEALKKEVSN